jgi:hypothetical protein
MYQSLLVRYVNENNGLFATDQASDEGIKSTRFPWQTHLAVGNLIATLFRKEDASLHLVNCSIGRRITAAQKVMRRDDLLPSSSRLG